MVLASEKGKDNPAILSGFSPANLIESFSNQFLAEFGEKGYLSVAEAVLETIKETYKKELSEGRKVYLLIQPGHRPNSGIEGDTAGGTKESENNRRVIGLIIKNCPDNIIVIPVYNDEELIDVKNGFGDNERLNFFVGTQVRSAAAAELIRKTDPSAVIHGLAVHFLQPGVGNLAIAYSQTITFDGEPTGIPVEFADSSQRFARFFGEFLNQALTRHEVELGGKKFQVNCKAKGPMLENPNIDYKEFQGKNTLTALQVAGDSLSIYVRNWLENAVSENSKDVEESASISEEIGVRFAFVEKYAEQCEVILKSVPELPQQRNLSCEAAAIRMVLAGRGIKVTEEEILTEMGLSENPHLGFRGDVDGYSHYEDLRDYGTCAEVVEKVLESFGVPAEAVYDMSVEQLKQAVAENMAVVVWTTGEKEPNVIQKNGYSLVEGEHVYVVIGVTKDGRFLVHDPWGARPNSGRTGTFIVYDIYQWDLFDRMAVTMPLS